MEARERSNLKELMTAPVLTNWALPGLDLRGPPSQPSHSQRKPSQPPSPLLFIIQCFKVELLHIANFTIKAAELNLSNLNNSINDKS
ncbi:hypothetical protein Scep_001580 [Stephania cephalantha]|uniref:Uncharacterized protein n=1 Tax=Stephania cephalantha TaxID=152367 RepID=A0AAP0Q567_9MAGN